MRKGQGACHRKRRKTSRSLQRLTEMVESQIVLPRRPTDEERHDIVIEVLHLARNYSVAFRFDQYLESLGIEHNRCAWIFFFEPFRLRNEVSRVRCHATRVMVVLSQLGLVS